MKKLIIGLVLTMSILVSITTSVLAAWNYDGYGFTSNVCRNGLYWQYVQWGYTNTTCYMPLHNLYGVRVAE